MIIAIFTGVIGHLAATFITILGSYGILSAIGLFNSIELKKILLLIGIVAFSRGILHYIEQTCNHYIAFKTLATLRDKVFYSLRKLAPAKLDVKNKGDLISIITGDIELLEVFYAHTISPVFIAIIVTVVMVIFMGSFHFILGLIALIGYVSIGVIIPVYASKKNRKAGEKSRKDMGNMNTFILDSLRGIKEIIQFDFGHARVRELNESGDELVNTQKNISKNRAINMAVTGSAVSLFSITILIVSIYLFNNNLIGADVVLISTVTMFSSFGSVIALANLGSGLTQTFADGNRVLNILDEKPKVVDVSNKKNIEFSGAKIDNVSFKYEGDELILKNINIDIDENKIIGIVGKSGSGKSTMLKLLMRFWDVDDGEVMLNPKNIKEINTSNLRNLESYVTQETILFQDSIINNILVGKLDATREDVIKVCKKASIDDFILRLPNGYDTDVGELGDTLSGGEKQRIGLARSFLHNAPLLLLDEPTSNIDSLNEAIILKAIREDRNRTTILVSHRESTMKIADRVINVENGRKS
jgi:ATP-binding cassette subfamily C protein